MLSLLQRVNILQLIGVKDMDKKKREGLKSPSLFYIYFEEEDSNGRNYDERYC